jgi:predicted RNA-binding protein with RPS1 domain
MTTIDQFKNVGKYNTSIKLTPEDTKAKVKIFCHEPYAQELYDAMAKYENSSSVTTKDLKENEVYKVRANTISFDDKMIYAEEVGSHTPIIVPFREYSKDLNSLSIGENRDFLVMVYKSTKHGENFGSEKKALSVSYKQELFDNLNENKWFDVTITKLIKGGYLALYKKEIECFIPGSHAAANVVHNFNDMLNKTLTVMVDNYDQSNDLFILSYKKYVAESMSTMIGNLSFNKEYTGVLTNKPYDFGAFVEIDCYFTGLVHQTEFKDYDTIRKTLKTGDTLKVYVKDITSKGNQFRIVLTLNPESVNSEKLAWQLLKEKTEGKRFTYDIDAKKNSISINIDGESYEVSLKRKELEKNLSAFPYVKVSKVDILNKSLKFEFVEDLEN